MFRNSIAHKLVSSFFQLLFCLNIGMYTVLNFYITYQNKYNIYKLIEIEWFVEEVMEGTAINGCFTEKL